MPRKARILVAGCAHHLVQRGHNRSVVLAEEGDCRYYLENLFEWKTALNIKVYAWCLMTNHIHLLVEPGDDPSTLSQLMKRINGRQAAYVNTLEGRSGALWEGRFKASPVQSELYLLSCLRYIELNPVRAGMVQAPEHYRWSSYRGRMGLRRDRLLDDPPAYLLLGNTLQERRRHYEAFVGQGIENDEVSFISESVNRNQLTGTARFVNEIEQKTEIRIERRAQGRPRK